jgi:hypothetical protein
MRTEVRERKSQMFLSTAAAPPSLDPAQIPYDDYRKLSREERAAFRNYAFEGPPGLATDEMSDLEFFAHDCGVTLESLLPCEVIGPDSSPHHSDVENKDVVRRKTDDECFIAEANLFDCMGLLYDVRGNPFRNAAVKLAELAAKIQAAADAMESKAVELDSESAADREGGAP